MIRVSSNIRDVQRILSTHAKQIPFATSLAINTTAVTAQESVIGMMKSVFDRPTPYTLRAIKVKKSTKQSLTANVMLNDDAPSKGTNWRDALAHHFVGGVRVKKKSELSLIRKGQFQDGRGFLGIGSGANRDQYGNLAKSKIVELMAYFNAFAQNGYKANMTDKKRARMAKGKRIVGPIQPSPYKKINGVVYFMSRGKGWFVGQGKGWTGGRNQPLAAGIWAKSGTHGSIVKPIMLAIKTPAYKRRIDMPLIVGDVVARDFANNFTDAYERAMSTAR